MLDQTPSIHIDPARIIDVVDPRIYSGFTEHMGRCIYGGLYDPGNDSGLVDVDTGFRKDVMDVLRELKIPLVRYPGGQVEQRNLSIVHSLFHSNFVSTYRWQGNYFSSFLEELNH